MHVLGIKNKSFHFRIMQMETMKRRVSDHVQSLWTPFGKGDLVLNTFKSFDSGVFLQRSSGKGDSVTLSQRRVDLRSISLLPPSLVHTRASIKKMKKKITLNFSNQVFVLFIVVQKHYQLLIPDEKPNNNSPQYTVIATLREKTVFSLHDLLGKFELSRINNYF